MCCHDERHLIIHLKHSKFCFPLNWHWLDPASVLFHRAQLDLQHQEVKNKNNDNTSFSCHENRPTLPFLPGANLLEMKVPFFQPAAARATFEGCTRRGQEKSVRAFPPRETLAKPTENFPQHQVSFCAPGTIPLLHTSNDMCRALRVWIICRQRSCKSGFVMHPTVWWPGSLAASSLVQLRFLPS